MSVILLSPVLRFHLQHSAANLEHLMSQTTIHPIIEHAEIHRLQVSVNDKILQHLSLILFRDEVELTPRF